MCSKKINAVFMYHFAERAGSRVSSADRPVPPEAEPRTDHTQWNAGWTAWNCEGRGTNKPHVTLKHTICVMFSMRCSHGLLSSSDISLLYFLDRSTSPWALHARRPPSVLCEHRGDRERWSALTVSLHTHTAHRGWGMIPLEILYITALLLQLFSDIKEISKCLSSSVHWACVSVNIRQNVSTDPLKVSS